MTVLKFERRTSSLDADSIEQALARRFGLVAGDFRRELAGEMARLLRNVNAVGPLALDLPGFDQLPEAIQAQVRGYCQRAFDATAAAIVDGVRQAVYDAAYLFAETRRKAREAGLQVEPYRTDPGGAG